MTSSRNRLYITLAIACIAGYAWLYFTLNSSTALNIGGFEGCIVKHVTDVPCPSCGSTRSVVALLNGGFLEAIYLNPIGIILSIILLIVPPWLLLDVSMGRSSMYKVFVVCENRLKTPTVAIPLVVLVVANWVWNIMKGL
jgi:hypothetical protein